MPPASNRIAKSALPHLLFVLIFIAIGQMLFGQRTFERWYPNLPHWSLLNMNDVIATPDSGMIMTGYWYNIYPSTFAEELSPEGDSITTFGYGNSPFPQPNENTRRYNFKQTEICANGDRIVVGSVEDTIQAPYDFYVSRYSSAGVKIWAREIKGAQYEVAQGVEELANGEILVGGTTNSFGVGGNDLLIAKYSSNGNLLWTRVMGTVAGAEGFKDMVATQDGGSVIAGIEGFTTVLVKLDSTGSVQWQRHYAVGSPTFIAEAADGTFRLGVNVNRWSPDENFGLLKLQANGTVMWAKSYGTAAAQRMGDGILNPDGSMAMVGGTNMTSPPRMILSKVDSGGNLLWTQGYMGMPGLPQLSIQNTRMDRAMEGGYVLAGEYDYYAVTAVGNSPGMLCVKTNASGRSFCTDQALALSTLSMTASSTVLNMPNSSGIQDTSVVEATLTTERNFPDDLLLCSVSCTVTAGFSSSAGQVCMGDTIYFTNTSQGSQTYAWMDSIGGTIQSTAQDYSVIASSPGTHSVFLEAFDGPCSDVATFSYTVTGPPAGFDLGPNRTVCTQEELDAGGPYASYLWSDNTTDSTLIVTQSGTYSVQVEDGQGCFFSDAVTLSIATPTVINLGPDIAICEGFPVTLTLQGGPFPGVMWMDSSMGTSITVDSTVTVWVEVEDVNGCTSRDTVEVTAFPLPVASFGYSVMGSTVQFSDSSQGSGLAWLWDFGDGNGTSTQQHPTYTYQNDGTYWACLSVVEAGCASAPVCDSITILTTGIPGRYVPDAVTLFPNPARDWIQIEGVDLTQIEVFDLTGRILMRAQPIIGANSHSFSLAQLQPGLYFVSIDWKGGTVVRRIVVE